MYKPRVRKRTTKDTVPITMDTFDNRDGLLGRGMRQGRGSDSLLDVLIPMGDWARRCDARIPLKSAGTRSTSLGNSSSEPITATGNEGRNAYDSCNLWTLPGLRKTPRVSHQGSAENRNMFLWKEHAFSAVPWKNADAFSHSAHRFLLLSLFKKTRRKEEENILSDAYGKRTTQARHKTPLSCPVVVANHGCGVFHSHQRSEEPEKSS